MDVCRAEHKSISMEKEGRVDMEKDENLENYSKQLWTFLSPQERIAIFVSAISAQYATYLQNWVSTEENNI